MKPKVQDFKIRLITDRGKTIEFSGPADITHETTDAIVNAANSSLLGGGGVDGAIHRAGGPAILAECREIVAKLNHPGAADAFVRPASEATGELKNKRDVMNRPQENSTLPRTKASGVTRSFGLPAGQAVITTGGNLAAKFVIHTVGPIYRDGAQGEAETLASCYRESIRLADAHRLQSLSFPAISTGAFGYPIPQAAAVAISSTVDALASAQIVNRVRFVFFDATTLQAFIAAAENILRSHPASLFRIEKAPS